MPAEWEPHAATWLAWPHNADDWPAKLAPVHWVYVEIVRHLSRRERVEILVQDDKLAKRIRRWLTDAGADVDRVGLHRCMTDRSWVRDSGPTFVVSPTETAAVCWRFNAWAKYANWTSDVLVARRIAELTGCRAIVPVWKGRNVVMEGGAIDADGAGLLLATEECLLSDQQVRNLGFSREDYERLFGEYLGIDRVVWLGRGIAGDDTHGHIDDATRFVGPNRAVTAVETDQRDENYQPLRDNVRRLQAAGVDVVELPMPKPLVFRGTRLPASYANFYIANDSVLVPTFNDPNDRHALTVIAAAFPEREIIGIHSVDLVWGLGTLHCSSQQQPGGPGCEE